MNDRLALGTLGERALVSIRGFVLDEHIGGGNLSRAQRTGTNCGGTLSGHAESLLERVGVRDVWWSGYRLMPAYTPDE